MLIMPENWEAVQIFRRCVTQWVRTGLNGQRAGLNYPSVESVMRMRGIAVEDQADVLDRIHIMERTVLGVDHDSRGKR